MQHKKLIFLLGLILLTFSQALSTHIVGAQLYYVCVNANTYQYKLTLKLYRDCLNGQAPFDDPITMFIFQGNNGQLFNTIDIAKPPFTPQIQPTNWGPCVATPPSLCIEEAIYETFVNLPPVTGGYDLAWARCCRNFAIDNLANPNGEGVTFLAHVPDPGLATCNSMPIFNNTPPLFLCNNQTFNFDYSATDADGDSLVYALSNPYTGLNFQGLGAGNPQQGGNPPVVTNGGNPMGPPPYQNVVFGGGFNAANPFGTAAAVSMNPQSGAFSVTPTQVGIYVFAVSVYEYRNGQLLSENKQDLQIHVLNCLPQNAPPIITPDLSQLNHVGDTILTIAQQQNCFPVTISAPIATGQLMVQQFGAPFSNGATFSYTPGTNPIFGTLCWNPGCQFVNQTIPVVFKAWDSGNCPGFGVVYDTVWVKVSLPPNTAPVISPDYTGLTVQSNTIIINATNELCYTFAINDIEGDSMLVSPVSPVFNSANPPVITIQSTNPFTGQICWTPDCSNAGQLIPITFQVKDFSLCNVTHTVSSTVNVLIQNPPNIAPALTTNLSGNVFSNDTIYATALSNLCFTYTGTDADVGDSLILQGVSPIFSAANPPTITMSGSNPVTGQICWTPSCQYVGGVVQLIIKVKDQGVCNNIGEDFDTVYVSVSAPINTPPIVNSNLSGTNFSNDTVFVFALDTMCFTFAANDINPGDSLTFLPISGVFTAANPPTVTFSGTNPITGQICWTPDCSLDGQTIPFIFGVKDQGDCNNFAFDFDTVYVTIDIPINTAPNIIPNFAGTNFSNDTLFVNALSGVCVTCQVTDLNATDSLQIVPLSPIFTDPANPPTFTVSGVNPLSGQICWTPGCQWTGQVIPFILQASDNARCNTDLSDIDTFYIAVQVPPNDTPAIQHDLTGNVFLNDTIFVDATDTLCYNLLLSDINLGDTLQAFTVSPIFSQPNGPVFTWSGINPLTGQVCWVVDCAYEGQTIPIIVGVKDNGLCNNTLTAWDTVYVKVSDPVTIPPIVGHDLTGTPHVGNVITLFQNTTACYDFYIADQTPDNGMIFTYECIQALTGANVGLGTLTSSYQNDSIIGQICLAPTCGNGGSTYYLIITGIDKATCPPFDETKDTVILKVNTNFFAIASNDTAFCAGSGGVQVSVSPFGGDAPYYYSWGCLNPLGCGISNPYISNPIINPAQTSQVWVQLADAHGCTSEIDTVLVTVNEIPIAYAGPDTAICEGGQGCTLQATIVNPYPGSAPYTYTWSPAIGLSDIYDPNPYCNPPSSQIYTLIVKDNLGCTSFTTTLDSLSTVIVDVIPRPLVEAGPTQHMCLGDSVQLQGYAYGTGPDYTYAWTPIAGISNPLIDTPFVSPPLTTTFTLVAWSNGCPSIGDTTTVYVHTMPTASPGVVYEICHQDSVALTGAAFGDWDSTATYTYSWSPTAGLNNPQLQIPMASPNTTTTYTLIATSSYGCVSAPYNVTVTVLPTAWAQAGTDTLICGETPITLAGSYTFTNGVTGSPVFAQWQSSPYLSNPLLPHPIATPPVTTPFVYTATVGACTTQDTVIIFVSPGFAIAATADTQAICKGDTISLHVIGGLGAPTYTWSPSVWVDNPHIQHPTAFPDSSTDFIVTVQEGNCTRKDTVRVTVLPTPTADYMSTNPNVCLDEALVMFSENATNEIAYIWDFGDGSPVLNFPNVTHTYTQAGNFTVTFTALAVGGCKDTYIGNVNVSAGPVASFSVLPSDSVLLPDAVATFTNTSLQATQYQWFLGEGATTDATHPTHTYETPGAYPLLLIATDEWGCTDSAQMTYYVVAPALFIPNIFTPNGDGIHDTWDILYTGKEPYYLQIFDRWGVKVFETHSPTTPWNGTQNSGQKASEGVYFYNLSIGKKNYNGNVTLMR